MKIAITGASGFIGGHVSRSLLDMGHQPTLMLRTSSCIPVGMENLVCIRHDIGNDPEGIYESLGSPDLLIHLAWGGLPNYRSLHHMTRELPAQSRFLISMIEAGLPKLVVTGTCFEYGMISGPLDENIPPRPENPYGLAKVTLLAILEMLQREKPFELTWARLFYLFGEGQAKSSLFSQICRAEAAGDSTFPMSGGEQLRDFMPIQQFRKDFVELALAPGKQGVVNLCSGRPISVRSLVESWIKEYKWKIKPDLGHYPYPDYEPMAFWGDRKKLDAILANK